MKKIKIDSGVYSFSKRILKKKYGSIITYDTPMCVDARKMKANISRLNADVRNQVREYFWGFK